MSQALPLFPDLLEQKDPFKRWADHKQRGHGVWPICNLYRSVDDNCNEMVALVVRYDDERYNFPQDKTGKNWAVEIKHHLYRWIEVETGWGASKRTKRQLRHTCPSHEKRFGTREEAIEFAEKVQAIIERMKAKRDDPANDEPEESPIVDDPVTQVDDS